MNFFKCFFLHCENYSHYATPETHKGSLHHMIDDYKGIYNYAYSAMLFSVTDFEINFMANLILI